MPRPHHPIAVALALCALASFAPAQDKPDVAALLDAMQKKMDPQGKRMGFKSMLVSGRTKLAFKSDGDGEARTMSGTFEEAVSGDRFHRWSKMGDAGKWENGVAKTLVWEIDPIDGVRILNGDDRAVHLRHQALRRGMPWRKVFPKVSFAGEQDGLVAVKLETECKLPETWYVDKKSHLLRRVEVHVTNRKGKVELLRVSFGDYREFAGVLFAYEKKIEYPDLTVVNVTEKVAVDVDLADARFSPGKAVLAAAQGPFPKDGDIEITRTRLQHIASIRMKIKPADIPRTLAKLLPEVHAYTQSVDAQTLGAPFSRYHSMGPQEIDLEVGIAVKKPIKGNDRVKPSTLPAGRAATTWHLGQYHLLGQTHGKLAKWIAEQKLETTGGPWEIYWTDPGLEPDPKKWRTLIISPVK